ncbi:MAG: tetratricopeptide repeat protein [Candidatus Nanoarchaeia archaeon]|nr:tetratricopeptide repeat protein [Candidatus Nanoarchaeia archaeon]
MELEEIRKDLEESKKLTKNGIRWTILLGLVGVLVSLLLGYLAGYFPVKQELEELNQDYLDLQKEMEILDKANLLREGGDYQGALELADQVLDKDPRNNIAWNARGNALFLMKDYEKALLSYEKAIEFSEGWNKGVAWHHKGLCLFYLGEYNLSVTAYDESLKINPSFENSWLNKGGALKRLELYEEALEAYDRVLQLNPNYAMAWYHRGITLTNLGDSAKAKDSLCQACRLDSNYCGTTFCN